MSLVVFTGFVGLVSRRAISIRCWPRSRCCASRSAPARAGAINMWYDRDIDALMRRTATGRCRRAGWCRARRWASAACWRSARSLVMGLARQSGGGGAAGADHRLLRLRLYDLAEAPHAAEHRHRRRRRRLSAAGRLGRGHRRYRLGRRSRCSRSSSSGRRRISGRWRSTAPAITPRPACRCCRSSPGRARPSGRCCSIRWCCGR